jgi:hypothetical protein
MLKISDLYEADFIQGLLKKNGKKLVRSVNFTFRYIDDVLSLNSSRLKELIQLCFIKKNGQRRYKYLVLGRDRSYFVKHHSDSTKKFSETDIFNKLEFLRIKEQVGEKRSTVCTHRYADCLLKNTSTKHNKYAVNQKLELVENISFRKLFGRIRG